MVTAVAGSDTGLAGLREQIVNDDPKLHATFEPGDVSHQGDLIIVGLAGLPKSAKATNNRQLADGNTQGSRHVLERGDVYVADGMEVVDMILAVTGCSVDAKYIGPVFVGCEDPTPDDLSHPEHGNQGFPAGTVCAVVYQRNLDAEEREQQTAD